MLDVDGGWIGSMVNGELLNRIECWYWLDTVIPTIKLKCSIHHHSQLTMVGLYVASASALYLVAGANLHGHRSFASAFTIKNSLAQHHGTREYITSPTCLAMTNNNDGEERPNPFVSTIAAFALTASPTLSSLAGPVLPDTPAPSLKPLLPCRQKEKLSIGWARLH